LSCISENNENVKRTVSLFSRIPLLPLLFHTQILFSSSALTMFSCFQTMWISALLAENTTECAVSALLILVTYYSTLILALAYENNLGNCFSCFELFLFCFQVIRTSSRPYLETNRVVASSPRFWSFFKQNCGCFLFVCFCLSKFMWTSGSIWIFEYYDKSTAIFSSK